MVVEMGVLHKNTVETLGLNLICDLCCDVFVSWKLHHIFVVKFSELPFFLSVESWLRWWTSSKNASRLWEASWLDIEALCSTHPGSFTAPSYMPCKVATLGVGLV